MRACLLLGSLPSNLVAGPVRRCGNRGRTGNCGAQRSRAAISKSLWERRAEPRGNGRVRSAAEREAVVRGFHRVAPSIGHSTTAPTAHSVGSSGALASGTFAIEAPGGDRPRAEARPAMIDVICIALRHTWDSLSFLSPRVPAGDTGGRGPRATGRPSLPYRSS